MVFGVDRNGGTVGTDRNGGPQALSVWRRDSSLNRASFRAGLQPPRGGCRWSATTLRCVHVPPLSPRSDLMMYTFQFFDRLWLFVSEPVALIYYFISIPCPPPLPSAVSYAIQPRACPSRTEGSRREARGGRPVSGLDEGCARPGGRAIARADHPRQGVLRARVCLSVCLSALGGALPRSRCPRLPPALSVCVRPRKTLHERALT